MCSGFFDSRQHRTFRIDRPATAVQEADESRTRAPARQWSPAHPARRSDCDSSKGSRPGGRSAAARRRGSKARPRGRGQRAPCRDRTVDCRTAARIRDRMPAQGRRAPGDSASGPARQAWPAPALPVSRDVAGCASAPTVSANPIAAKVATVGSSSPIDHLLRAISDPPRLEGSCRQVRAMGAIMALLLSRLTGKIQTAEG